ncbi:hypothetical protein [Brachybacterium paraconglomeratum]|uniref:hypothetical protein n=1 Tax=Brachybacterium paraconglomeratum TaxID=173362 RepID=UPI0022AF5C6C|nr:hypothetical protein [Brachybacterium paraconglomeratum]MCZ4326728.1 hypothetical protein [Brachybacterium paraconglomeratum]
MPVEEVGAERGVAGGGRGGDVGTRLYGWTQSHNVVSWRVVKTCTFTIARMIGGMSPSPASFLPGRRASSSTFQLVRSGSLTENVADAATRIDEFAALARTQSPVLVVERAEGSVRHFVVLSGRGDHHRAAESLGHAVAAKAVPIPRDEQLSLENRAVQRLVVPRWRYQTGRSTLAGQNPYEVAQRAASALREDGQWLAVTFRAPSSRERSKWDLFMESRDVQTHHSREHGSVMASFFAGGSDAVSNRDALVSLASSMPGFDEIANPSGMGIGVSLRRALLAVVAGAVGALGVVLGVKALTPLVAEASAELGFPVNIQPLGPVLAVVPVLLGIFLALRPLLRALRLRASALPVFVPRRRWRTTDPETKTLENGTVQREEGKRPLHREVFKLSPVAFVGVLAPHVGSESGSGVTQERSAPSEVTQRRIGFTLGVDRRGARVQLPAISSYEGTALVGLPGKGKSQLQQAQFAHQLLERTTASEMPHSPGSKNTIVFFDTTGGTWSALARWCEQYGVDPVVIHAADDPYETVDEHGQQLSDAPRRQNSDVIDVLWSRGDADRRGRFIADMLKQTLDEGAVQGQSLETLTKVFTAAVAVTPSMVDAARAAAAGEGVPFIPEGSPATIVSIAWAFLGDPDVRTGELLYAQLNAQAQTDRGRGASTDAVIGAQALSSLYGGDLSRAARRPLLQASRNKVSLMQTAPHFWDIVDHSELVGTYRPGSEQWRAKQAEHDADLAADPGITAPDPAMGFTAVENPFSTPSAKHSAPADEAGTPAEGPTEPSSTERDAPGRRVHTWEELLRGHEVVIINTGVAPHSDTDLPEEGKELVTSIIFFSMVRAIQRVASGWREEGRRITVMADELSMIVAENGEMVEWLRDKGRQYGVELSLATQRPGQIPPKVLESFFSFGTLIAFAQDNPEVADTIARNLAGDGSPWSSQDVVNLPAFNVIVRTRTDRRLPAFTAVLTDFEAEPDRFTAFQTGTAPLPGERTAAHRA